MDKQTARSLLMDFLYDEISAEEQEKLEAYLDTHPDLFEELKELRKTQKMLGQMPEPDRPRKLHIVEPRRRSFGMWWDDVKTATPRSGWGKAGLAAAVCLLFLLVVGSIVNLQIRSGKAGFYFSLGYGNKIEQLATEEQEHKHLMNTKANNKVAKVKAENLLTEKEAKQFITAQEAQVLLAKIQQQNRELLASFAKKMNKQDRQQLQKIVKYFQAQRLYDLKRINRSLNRTQLANVYRWHQTNRLLSEIIQTASIKK